MGETETVEEKGILLRLAELYRNLGQAPLYILFMLTVIIPMVYPLGLPIGVTHWTKDYKAQLDAVPAGGTMLLTIDYCTGGESTRGPAAIDTIKYLMRKNVKVISIAILMPVDSQLILNVFEAVDWAGKGYQYGTDYVTLGYVVGYENYISALRDDFIGTAKVDYYGTSVQQLPLIMETKNGDDIDIVAVMSDYGGPITVWGRQWPRTATRGMVCATITGDVLAYYPHIYGGFLDASGSGVAEFEVVAGVPGAAVIGTDILSLGQGFLLVIILLSNLTYWYVRRKRGE